VRHVKWLTKIEASSEEALGPWQRGIAYKGFPPSLKDFKDAKPELVPSMQKVPVQSVICFPADGDSVRLAEPLPTSSSSAPSAGFFARFFGLGQSRPIDASNLEPEPTAPPTTYALTKSEKGEPCINVRGWAYSGGGNGIVRVDVSGDDGKTWHTATLKEGSEQPIHQAYAWTFWEIDLPLADSYDSLKSSTTRTIVCKALDASYNVQPETVDAIWNARGLNNTAWHRVEVKLEEP